MKDLAPIILFVYNRPWHTRQTLEALKRNELAKDSLLYIFSDGPKENSSEEELIKIKEVRSLIREENWCGEVRIIERDKNLGLANSVIKGVSQVIAKHGHVIVLEDDIVTGKYFLKFMNEGLTTYKAEEKVFGISGYKYPSEKRIKETTYFLPIASSWSFATWQDRWDRVNFNGSQLLKKVDSGGFNNELDFGGNSFYAMLKDQIAGKNDSWAIRFYVSMFLEKAYFLYPNKSLIKNIGFDNTGVHCGYDNYYSTSLSQQDIKVGNSSIRLDTKIVHNVEKSFRTKFIGNVVKASLFRKVNNKLRKILKSLRITL